MQTLFTVSDLTYLYGERRAVNEVSFAVQAGECFGLLGPNGAGKTTTISCIAGLLADWRGAMNFKSREFKPATVLQDRAQLGLVPQELAIYGNLTAEENLDFFASLSGVSAAERPQRVTENLRLAGLEDRRRDRVRTFSGGMKRRLNLVAGLTHSPALLLLDEPTVGVDPQSRNHIFGFVRRICG